MSILNNAILKWLAVSILMSIGLFASLILITKQAHAQWYPPEIWDVSATLSPDQNTVTFDADGYGGCLDTIDPDNSCATTEYIDLTVDFDVQRIVNNAHGGDQWTGYIYYGAQTTRWFYPGFAPPDQESPVGLNGTIDASSWPSGTYRLCATVQGSVTALWPLDAYGTESLCTGTFTITRAQLSCGTNQIVIIGSTASFQLNMVNASTEYSVTMSANPTGPLMSNSPFLLNSGNSYTGIAQVPTTGLTGGQTYQLTFTATAGAITVQCNVNLTVQSSLPVVDLLFDGSDGPVILTGNTTSGTISWVNTDVANCTASVIPSPNTLSPAWSGPITPVASGSLVISGLAYGTAYTFTLSCTGPGGSDYDSVQVSSVAQTSTVDLYCREGKSTHLTACNGTLGGTGELHWNTTWASTCNLTDDDGNPDPPGYDNVALNVNFDTPFVVGTFTGTTTYTLSCYGADGALVTDSVDFTVVGSPGYTFAINPPSGSVSHGNTNTTYGEVYNPVEGFNSNVTVAVQSICEQDGGGCVAAGSIPSIISLNNAVQVSPYLVDTEAVIDSTSLNIETYIITFTADAASGVPAQKTSNYTLIVNPPAVLNPPTTVKESNLVCGEVSVTWEAPVSGSPSAYRIYRRTSGDLGSGVALYTTDDANPPYSYTDTSGVAGTFYEYGVVAVYGSAESTVEWATAVEYLPCVASMSGSFKKLVGVGKTTPIFVRCDVSGGGFTMPPNQIFQSGDTVYFEICVRSTGTANLNSVIVTETLAQDLNLENIKYENSESDCATGLGSGPFTIGTMSPGSVCSILVSATLSNPGGPASALNYFANFAELSSTEIATFLVNTTPEPFVIGSDAPTRAETAR